MQKEKEKKTILFSLFGDIERYTKESMGTMCKLAAQFDKFIVGDKTRREQFRLVLRINSNGGSMETAIALYSYFRNLPIGLTTVGYGFVESAAVYVFLAGKERICMPETRFFIHGGGVSLKAPASELNTAARKLVAQQRLLENIIADNVGIPLSTIKKWMLNGKSFYAEEALEYGFVTAIGTNPICEDDSDYTYLAERW